MESKFEIIFLSFLYRLFKDVKPRNVFLTEASLKGGDSSEEVKKV